MHISRLFRDDVFFITSNRVPRTKYKEGQEPTSSRYRVSFASTRQVVPVEFVQLPFSEIARTKLPEGFFLITSDARKTGEPGVDYIINGNIIDWNRTKEDEFYSRAGLGTYTQIRIKGSHDYYVLSIERERLKAAADAAKASNVVELHAPERREAVQAPRVAALG